MGGKIVLGKKSAYMSRGERGIVTGEKTPHDDDPAPLPTNRRAAGPRHPAPSRNGHRDAGELAYGMPPREDAGDGEGGVECVEAWPGDAMIVHLK